MQTATVARNAISPSPSTGHPVMRIVPDVPPIVQAPEPVSCSARYPAPQPPMAVNPRKLDNTIPRRNPALFLNAQDYDDLTEQLTRDLNPPNQLAVQTIRLLAQELIKLQFIQRVEFTLMAQAQEVEEREWQDLEHIRRFHARERSSDECRRELQALRALVKNIYENRESLIRVPPHDLECLATVVWNRITFWERQIAQANRELQDVIEEERGESDVSKERLAKDRQEKENSLREFQQEDQKSGRMALGVQSQDDVRAILSGERLIPTGKQDAWEDMLQVEISVVGETEQGALLYEKRLSAMQTRAAQQAVQAVDTLGPVRQHSATVWKNIDKCLHRLELVGVNIKGTKAKLITLEEERGHATR